MDISRGVTVIRFNRKYLRYRLESLLNRQNMLVICPCCGLKFREFVKASFLNPEKYNPARYQLRKQEVFCPYCQSMPRHRILAQWCENHKDILQATNILYFAPEHSMTLWMKKNGINVATADLYGRADLKLDIQETGLPDDSYDVVIANHVLEHVDDFRQALKEVHRILKPGGLFICSFPMDPKVELVDEDPSVNTDQERYSRFGQVDHKRVFGMKADQFLTEAGFSVETINGEDYPEEILPVVGPADYDINRLFCCKKE